MVEVRTKYTLETYSEFLKFSFFRGKHSRLGHQIYRVIEIILVVMFFVLIFGFLQFPYPPVLFLVVAAFLFAAQNIIPGLFARSYAKKAAGLFNVGLDIAFKKNNVYISTTGESEETATKMPYNLIVRAFEVSNAYYLYIVHGQELILSKKDFINDNPDDLRIMLEEKIGKRYVLCK